MAGLSAWQALSNEFASAIEKVGKSVVAVNARRRIPSSGVLWKPGIIVTADHTIGRDEDITIILPGGTNSPATLVGRDATTDLAILRIELTELVAPEIGTAAALKAGNWLLTAGRTFEGVTRGGGAMVSVAGPAWKTWRGGAVDQTIRLDRNLHPNFSGGPAVDEQGRVLGITTSGLSRIGAVVIPASTVERVAGELAKKGHIGRGYLGVGMQPVRLSSGIRESLKISNETGIMIMGVEAGSPAEKGGLVMGDVLFSIDGDGVSDTDELQQYLTGDHVGKTLKATVVRGGAVTEVRITVGERAAGN